MLIKTSKLYRITALLFFVVLLTFVIIIAKKFLYPIALGILFAYLLYPIANFFEKKLRFPRIFSNLTSIILAGIILAIFFSVIYSQLKIIIEDLPAIKKNIISNVEVLTSFITRNFGIDYSIQKNYIKDYITHIIDSSSNYFGEVFTTTTGTLVRIGLLPVYIFFMLFYRDKAYKFLILMTIPESRSKVIRIVNEISSITKKYMGGVSIVVFILSFVNSIGLEIVGMKYPIFFGIIAAVCNFIPYFGTIIGYLIPFVFALLIMPPNVAFGIVLLFFIVQFTENNILTPNIVGSNVRLNPFIIILSLMIGAMVWGIPGMLVVVPLIAVLRVVCENIESLKPIAFLLGVEGAEKHALTYKNIKRFFLRFKKGGLKRRDLL